MTNLTDVTIILDNSQLKQDDKPRAEGVEKLSTKTDSSKPLEANHDEAKTGKEARDSSLLLLDITTTDDSQFNQSAKDIERDSTKPNSAKPSENNLKEVDNVQKCEDSTSTSNSLTGAKSERTQDTAISRPISANLKEKESNENIKELSVENPMDAKANVEGDANMEGGKGETMREVFDILDESKSGHISPVSFGHLIRSLGDLSTSKSVSNTIISRILPN